MDHCCCSVCSNDIGQALAALRSGIIVICEKVNCLDPIFRRFMSENSFDVISVLCQRHTMLSFYTILFPLILQSHHKDYDNRCDGCTVPSFFLGSVGKYVNCRCNITQQHIYITEKEINLLGNSITPSVSPKVDLPNQLSIECIAFEQHDALCRKTAPTLHVCWKTTTCIITCVDKNHHIP